MPVFVPRAEWGNNRPRGGYPIGGDLGKLVIHHTPAQLPTTHSLALWELGRILSWHLGNGWGDIGYTFVIWDSYVFEGRGWGRTGAHAPGANSSSIGLAFLLDGRVRLPTAVELASARWLVQESISRGYLSPSYATFGHRDYVATECPSQPVYDYLGKIIAALHGPAIVEPVNQLPTVPVSPPGKGAEQVLVVHRPNIRKTGFSDPGIPGNSQVFDFSYLPSGASIVINPLEPTLPEFNAVLYTASKGRGEVQLVTFAGAVLVVPAPGKASLVIPGNVPVDSVDCFAREIA